jgi:hypothetical protein
LFIIGHFKIIRKEGEKGGRERRERNEGEKGGKENIYILNA